MLALRRFLIAALVCYVALVAMLYALQRQLIYPGTGPDDGSWNDPPAGYDTVILETADALHLKALYRPAEQGRHTLLFFHGNGDSALNSAIGFGPVLADGQGALMVSYRGYAGNPGTPDEQGLYRDGEAGLAFLRAQGIEDTSIVVGGFSLGTGVASHVARQGEFAGLLLIAPFTTLPEAARASFPWLPTDLLMRDQYPTRDRIADGTEPLLLVHGAQDSLIPVRHSQRLAELRPDATVVIIPDAEHNDIAFFAQDAIREWLGAL